MVEQERSENDLDGPADIYLPTDGYHSPKLGRSPVKSLLSQSTPISPLLPLTLPHERSLTFVLDRRIVDLFYLSLDTSAALVIPGPCQSFFFKTLGCTLTRKSTSTSTYSLIQDSTSVCSLDTQGSFSDLQPWPTEKVCTFRFSTSKLPFMTRSTV